MNTILIAICEDNEEEYRRLSDILQNSEIPCSAEWFRDGDELLHAYYPGKYDLLLMDIFMNRMNGVDAASKIREIDREVPIAFITTSLDYTLEGYRLHVNRYLHKPLDPSEVRETVELAVKEQRRRPSLSVRTDGRDLSLPLARITYIEQDNRSSKVFLTGGEMKRIPLRLDDLEKMLPFPPFFRCHKSFIANLSHVQKLNAELLLFEMSDGGAAYIRRNTLKEAKDVLKSYMFSRARGDLS
ncbi:MAG: LytTR family DNA-binding domain-containing protein [Clostridium sp.]|nr:LytTR family DNA-binding domain-containing protein [Clostridium sp.]